MLKRLQRLQRYNDSAHRKPSALLGAIVGQALLLPLIELASDALALQR